jgi:cytochrome P450
MAQHDLPSLADAAWHRDPYPLYAALRAQHREHGLFFDDAIGLWVACTADAVEAVLQSPALRVRPLAEPVPAPLQGRPAGQVFGGLMRMNEGATAHEAPKIRARQLLAGLQHAAREAGRAAAAAFTPSAHPIDTLMFDAPLQALAHLLQVPPGRHAALAADVRRLVAAWSPRADEAQRRQGDEAAQRLLALFNGDANRIGLFTQTCEATAALIGNALIAWRREAHRWPLDEAFIAEVGRHDAPVQNTRRFAGEAVAIRGQALQPGDAVLVLLASANRDEAAQPEPDRFDPARASARCWSWGAGRHACPGEALSRTIALQLLQAWMADGHAEALQATTRHWRYRPSPNARLPEFTEGA